MLPSYARTRRGFTMIQLLVVILVVGLAVTLLMTVIFHWRLQSLRAETNNRLKDLCLAMHACNDTHHYLPPAFDKFAQMDFPASVHVHLLPFLDSGKSLFSPYLAQQGGGDTKNFSYPKFLSSQDYSRGPLDMGIQNFAANLRVFSDKGIKTNFEADLPPLASVEPGRASIPKTFVDGSSNVVVFSTKLGVCGSTGGSRYAAEPNTPFAAFFGEAYATVLAHPSDPKAAFQLAPNPVQCLTSPLMAQSFDQMGILVGFGDASVRNVPPKLTAGGYGNSSIPGTPKFWNMLLCPCDREPFISSDWDF